MCYWFGGKVTSREHVPSRCLFPQNRRTNLLTVPSCDSHNNAFKLLDERMRLYLLSTSDNPDAIEQFNDKARRSLLKPEGARLKAKFLKNFAVVETPVGQMGRLELDLPESLPFFEKIVRGIYYLVRKAVFEGGFCVGFRQNFPTRQAVAISGLSNQLTFEKLGPLLTSNLVKAGKVSQPEIFSYKYLSVADEQREAFVVVMSFYQSFEVIGTLHRNIAAFVTK